MRELLARLNFMGFQFEAGPEARPPCPHACMCRPSSAVQHVPDVECKGMSGCSSGPGPCSLSGTMAAGKAIGHHVTRFTTAVSARWSARGWHEGRFRCWLKPEPQPRLFWDSTPLDPDLHSGPQQASWGCRQRPRWTPRPQTCWQPSGRPTPSHTTCPCPPAAAGARPATSWRALPPPSPRMPQNPPSPLLRSLQRPQACPNGRIRTPKATGQRTSPTTMPAGMASHLQLRLQRLPPPAPPSLPWPPWPPLSQAWPTRPPQSPAPCLARLCAGARPALLAPASEPARAGGLPAGLWARTPRSLSRLQLPHGKWPA